MILSYSNESLIESSCTQPAWDIVLLYMKEHMLSPVLCEQLEEFCVLVFRERVILLEMFFWLQSEDIKVVIFCYE